MNVVGPGRPAVGVGKMELHVEFQTSHQIFQPDERFVKTHQG